jgi:CDP-diacylglycerol---glycerol-3-phosphate 3-phosphatidyltransferase
MNTVQTIKTTYSKIISPIIKLLIILKISPATLTVIGFFLNGVSAFLFSRGSFRWAGLMMLIGGAFDTFDGQVARSRQTDTKFGAFFDSTVDRFSEILILMGLLLYYLEQHNDSLVIVVAVVIAGSLMVSYIRARAEGVGQVCTVGLLQRPGRVVLLVIGALGGVTVISITLWIIAIGSVITVLQRFHYVTKQLRSV